jgi:hypothetical protein
MNRRDLLFWYDKDLRLRIRYPEARQEITRDVVRLIRKAPGMNVVAFTFANEARLHEVIHRELDYFAPMQQPFTWKVYEHDRLPNLRDELLDHGFSPDNDPAAVMVLDLDNKPDLLAHPVQADIRRITTLDGLKDIVYVLDQVWGGHNSWVYERLGSHLQVPGYLSVYAAYVEDEPASIAWTYFPRGSFATMFAGSTIAKYRRQGLYTGLLATRLREIDQRGYRFAVVEAGSMSRPIVERHGFQHLTTVYDYEWQGS